MNSSGARFPRTRIIKPADDSSSEEIDMESDSSSVSDSYRAAAGENDEQELDDLKADFSKVLDKKKGF